MDHEKIELISFSISHFSLHNEYIRHQFQIFLKQCNLVSCDYLVSTNLSHYFELLFISLFQIIVRVLFTYSSLLMLSGNMEAQIKQAKVRIARKKNANT